MVTDLCGGVDGIMCACSGERAGCVTGLAAGEGEGRSVSAPAKRGAVSNGNLMANRWCLACAR
jgi:hypothetical protein